MKAVRVGFTTTIPIEVLYAAGRVPADLNNLFITSPDPQGLVRAAEADGFPRNSCSWVKGIYGVVRREGLSDVVAVTQGDCSFTQALMEVLAYRGVRIVPFAFPFDRDAATLRLEIRKFCGRLGAPLRDAMRWKERLDAVRRLAWEIDRLTWEEGKVTGEENHAWLVDCSDFRGDPERYRGDAAAFLAAAAARPPSRDLLPLAFVGVPPIVSGLHAAVEGAGARFVLNEVQRQFAMPSASEDLVSQYLAYTYPYPFAGRLDDIRAEVRRRGVRGIVHYVQSFCFRQIEDILLREEAGVPVLTLEGDAPGPLDERTRIRLLAFIEMLRGT